MVCGRLVAKGSCIPIRVSVTDVPLMVVVAGDGAYELMSPGPLVANTPITSPERTGMLTGMTPVEGSFWVTKSVVKALVVVA